MYDCSDVGSVEDVLLQQCEVNVECTHPKYPKNVMHVFIQNKYCDEWNELILKSSRWYFNMCCM